MSNFTPEAKKIWEEISAFAQEKLISNVYCGQCMGMTTIIDFKGELKAEDLVLSGKCQTCGSEVARLVESD